MELVAYFLVFAAAAVILFIVSRVWIGLADTVSGWLKKALFKNRKTKAEANWHTLEDIRKQKNVQ